MRKARFTEHQIIAVIKSVEAGRTVKVVSREAGISEATYYNWKFRYGGMVVSDIKNIKYLEDDNRRLKQILADLSLENWALTSSKKTLKPAFKRELVTHPITTFRQACRSLNLGRTVYHYRPDTKRDKPVIFLRIGYPPDHAIHSKQV